MIFKYLRLLAAAFALTALFSSCNAEDSPSPVDSGSPTTSASDTTVAIQPEEFEPEETECSHEFSDWSIIKNASCTEEGTLERSCTKCGYGETSSISQIEHTPIVLKSVAATCSSTGLTDGSKCSVCDEILVSQEVIDKSDHSPVTIKSVSATCTNTGLTEGSKCSSCGTVLVAQKTVNKTSHVPVPLKAIAPTCSSTGLTEGSKCSSCGVVLTSQNTIPKNAHVPTTVKAVPATCTSTGLSEGSKCSICGSIITAQKNTAALGHSFTNGECSRCGYSDPNQLNLEEYYSRVVYPAFDVKGNGYTTSLNIASNSIYIYFTPLKNVISGLHDGDSSYDKLWELYKSQSLEITNRLVDGCVSFDILNVKVVYYVSNPFDEDKYLLECVNGVITYDYFKDYVPSVETQSSYGVGDTWIVPDQWEFTVDSVTTHYGCNQFADENDMPMFVTITFSYKNLGYVGRVQNLFISSVSFDVYDETGEAAETYPCTHDKASKVINVGSKCTGAQETYALYNKSDYITLVFEQYTSNNTGKKSVTYKLKIS